MAMHILVPIDDSEPAKIATDYAFNTFPEAQITLLHVIDVAEEAYRFADADMDARAGQLTKFEAVQQERRSEAEQLLDEHVTGATNRGLSVETVIKVGDPTATILRYAEDKKVDSIIVGSHGRTGVTRILLGSVAETVARRAPCPVTIVR